MLHTKSKAAKLWPMDTPVPRTPFTLESFLVWEREQELCYEFDAPDVVEVNGASFGHQLIAANVVSALERVLPPPEWFVLFMGIKVLTPGRSRYPDVVVTRSAPAIDTDIIPDPLLVVEVVSPGNPWRDRVMKREDYRGVPSILHYLILSHDRVAVTALTRHGPDWLEQDVISGYVNLTHFGVSIPVLDLYQRLPFAPTAG